VQLGLLEGIEGTKVRSNLSKTKLVLNFETFETSKE